jgi:glycosyltransferase involved in cell wall biosynthesis
MNELKKKFQISDQYILFVGTLQPRKNITRLIEAFSCLKPYALSLRSLQLVIVGKKGWQYKEILKAPNKFGVADRVKFLDFVSDEDLPSLYKNALCYVLPSLYEGFGLPVLEAMKYDCPVITSNVSSLPEAGGDAALYVDPMNVQDIAEKIELLIRDEKLRRELIGKGRKQIKKFSWEKAAKETLKVLGEIVYEG